MNRATRLTSGTKRVARCELPHACEELAEAADEEGHADDDVRGVDVVCLDIDEGENERGGGEGEEAAVGDLVSVTCSGKGRRPMAPKRARRRLDAIQK